MTDSAMLLQQYWETVNAERRISSRLEKGFFRSPVPAIFTAITNTFFVFDTTKKVCEIGCAPGHKLVDFARRYGYQPYGVEYTAVGVQTARETFIKHHFPTENIFFNDFFDAHFQHTHHNEFDVVMSFGFIEHFNDPRPVIKAHLTLLKPGGLLLIMIPNLKGIYYPLLRLLAPDRLAIHNLAIMNKNIFIKLFHGLDAQELFCDYYGLLNFGLLQARGSWRQALLKMLWRIQLLCNPFLSFVRHPRLENAITSPYVLYIGRKK